MQPFDLKPSAAGNVYIAPGAQVVGDVRLCDASSVWYNAVLRGDMASITLGSGSNVQDNCTLHCDAGVPLVIGNSVTIGHNAVLHSCTVGDGSLIGMGAVVLSGAAVGKGCIVAAGSVVTSKTVMPDGSLFIGIPAKLKRMLSVQEQKELINKASNYSRLAAQYKSLSKAALAGKCVSVKGLDELSLGTIKKLEDICEKNDPVRLKLNWSMLENRNPDEMNDIFYFDGEMPVGYLGLYAFGNDIEEIELTGMVNPEYRRRGIFTVMLNKALGECHARGAKKALLVTEKGCSAGEKLAKKAGMSFEHTEYGMRCEKSGWNMSGSIELTFRKAVNRDLKELAFIDMMGFDLTQKQAESYYEQPSLKEIYIAEIDGRPVGKIGISDEHGEGYVFGLVVAPNYRGRGYGREILNYAMDIIFSSGSAAVTLEVDDTNSRALSLYRSCGFNTVTQYDYYEITLQ